MKVTRLGWMGAKTRFARMNAFYRGVLGLAVLSIDDVSGRFRLDDGTEVHVYGPQDADHAFFGKGPVVAFEVDDFAAARARLLDVGTEFIREEPQRASGRIWQHFIAPDGNVYEIIGADDAVPARCAKAGRSKLEDEPASPSAAMKLPFVNHVGARIEEQPGGLRRCTLSVQGHHFNSAGTVHGGVLFTLADTAMGAAFHSTLTPSETCATVEIRINYFRPVVAGAVVCTGEIISKGKTVANLEACIYAREVLVAKANGTFSVQRRGHTGAMKAA